MKINEKAKKNVAAVANKKDLSPSEAVNFMYEVYNLDRIEEIIEQIKIKHIDNELSATQKAALRILNTYLDLIT